MHRHGVLGIIRGMMGDHRGDDGRRPWKTSSQDDGVSSGVGPQLPTPCGPSCTQVAPHHVGPHCWAIRPLRVGYPPTSCGRGFFSASTSCGQIAHLVWANRPHCVDPAAPRSPRNVWIQLRPWGIIGGMMGYHRGNDGVSSGGGDGVSSGGMMGYRPGG